MNIFILTYTNCSVYDISLLFGFNLFIKIKFPNMNSPEAYTQPKLTTKKEDILHFNPAVSLRYIILFQIVQITSLIYPYRLFEKNRKTSIYLNRLRY